jgi:hypothetical protein
VGRSTDVGLGFLSLIHINSIRSSLARTTMMRTIRQLQDLRRIPPVVNVQNAGQVNVGQQQVNTVAGG